MEKNYEIENIVKNWSKAQKAGALLPCPRCGKMKLKKEIDENALSRRADIYVCSSCGTEEALEDYWRRREAEMHTDAYKESFIKNWWLIREVLGRDSIIDRKNEWEFKAERTVIVTQEDIDDIMAGALEGGITYWCCKAEVVEDDYYGEYASEQISRGGSLRLYDNEEDEQYILTLDKFLKGLRLAIKDGYGNDWFGDDARLDCAMIDGEAADVIVQCALFGEVQFG